MGLDQVPKAGCKAEWGEEEGSEESEDRAGEGLTILTAVTSSYVIHVMIFNNQSSSHAHTFTQSEVGSSILRSINVA